MTVYLVYCVRRDAFDKIIGATVIGPVKETREEAEQEMIDLKTKGWDASWVELGPASRWIVEETAP